jgi:hypothetical protein
LLSFLVSSFVFPECLLEISSVRSEVTKEILTHILTFACPSPFDAFAVVPVCKAFHASLYDRELWSGMHLCFALLRLFSFLMHSFLSRFPSVW